MYDELVKSLRICTSDKRGYGCGTECSYGKAHPRNYWCMDYLLKEAADTIEKLSKTAQKWELEAAALQTDHEYLIDENRKLVAAWQNALDLRNRWISVEERLPNEKGVYIVTYHPCYWDDVNYEKVKLGTDKFLGKQKWCKRKYRRVTHWMPLPQPPKEET